MFKNVIVGVERGEGATRQRSSLAIAPAGFDHQPALMREIGVGSCA